ncbi:SPOR domain-containing protein [Photobacterium atrarenae]|uniref:SPOR domain-containing protein n=1 Tax=Photobacterium atrarenae TaxID=865757 RepID=A0ABY5GI64_9GAMM|nr:SPOR domain-containing protein [Photobacterium atrarenae]UTV28866.1 SPOR domain-containing protein [Photobacterium atrarenae]
MINLHLRFLVFSALLTSAFFSGPNYATTDIEATHCQVEKTERGWQFLNAGCDIGTGLWGKTGHSGRSFWLQCHYGKYLPNRDITSTLQAQYPKHLYLIPDQGNLRCLIGPFPTWSQAVTAKKNLAARKLTDTFIRQTLAPITVAQSAALPTPKSRPGAQRSRPVETPRETLIENRVVMNSAIYAFTFERLNYHQPMNISSVEEMPPMMNDEYGHFWSKVNYQTAESWCRRYGLRLPTLEELTALHTYGQHHLLRLQWPIKANYWSSTLSFYSGEVKTLNLRSGRGDEYRPLALLYTTCVGSAD